MVKAKEPGQFSFRGPHGDFAEPKYEPLFARSNIGYLRLRDFGGIGKSDPPGWGGADRIAPREFFPAGGKDKVKPPVSLIPEIFTHYPLDLQGESVIPKSLTHPRQAPPLPDRNRCNLHSGKGLRCYHYWSFFQHTGSIHSLAPRRDSAGLPLRDSQP